MSTSDCKSTNCSSTVINFTNPDFKIVISKSELKLEIRDQMPKGDFLTLNFPFSIISSIVKQLNSVLTLFNTIKRINTNS